MVIVFLSQISPSVSAQQLHDDLIYEVINPQSGIDKNYHINVGNGPYAIGVNPDTNTIYVVNQDDNTISVIDGFTNTKKVDDIKVGELPYAIGVNPDTNTIYVVNSDTISVIDGENNTKNVDDIKVPLGSAAIAVDSERNTIYVVNNRGAISVIDGETRKIVSHMGAGFGAMDIGVNPGLGSQIYVANSHSDTVSILDKYTHLKRVDDVKVGKRPSAIGVGWGGIKTYVVNHGNNSVSVIDGSTDRKNVDDIKVGGAPRAIGVGPYGHKIYVANSFSDTVSVIDGSTDRKNVDDIKVGKHPIAVGVNIRTNTIYVVTYNDNSVSVIDGVADRVVGGFLFNVAPFNSGYIKCGEVNFPTSKYLYIWSGSSCTAIPNKGFEFLSWEENLGKNGTQIINVSKPATPLESILDIFNLKPEEPEATLGISTFGSFTANFKELPPPLPAEYWTTLFAFVLTTGLGVWLIPSLVRWTRTRADTKKSDYYYQRIKSLYDDDRLDENDLKDLDKLKTELTDAHSKGKINELHYNSLKNEISMSYDKIFRKRIDTLRDVSDRIGSKEQFYKLKEDIENSYSEQKITELQFNLLNKKISDLEDKDNG